MSVVRRERSISARSADESDAASLSSVASRSRRASVASRGSRLPVSRCASVSLSKDAGANEGPPAAEEGTSFLRMSRIKKLTFMNFCLTNFCVGAFYSLLAPFFPNEAVAKGVSPTMIGLIFGSFELILFLTAPIFGSLIGKVGGKFMYITGVAVCGCTAILFGFLDWCPPGTIYIVMCFLVRSFEALSAAAFSTASFAILAYTFPDNVATMFGSLELFSGLGMMVGPPLGGALYTLGGFKLPFLSMGGLLIVVAFISIFILPSPDHVDKEGSGGSVFSVLFIPINLVVCLLLVSGAACIGFLDVSLSIHLSGVYQLSPLLTGVVFLVGPGVYALTAPIWGYVGDRWPQYSQMIMTGGYVIGGTGFMLMGPAPFLPINDTLLWLLLVGLGMMGFGIGTLVLGFQVMADATKDAGFPETLATFGLISGVFNSFFSLGAFGGPLVGGYLVEKIKFEWSAFVVGSLCWVAALVLLVFMLISSQISKKPTTVRIDYREPDERQALLADSAFNRSYVRESRITNTHANTDGSV